MRVIRRHSKWSAEIISAALGEDLLLAAGCTCPSSSPPLAPRRRAEPLPIQDRRSHAASQSTAASSPLRGPGSSPGGGDEVTQFQFSTHPSPDRCNPYYCKPQR
uniref:Uncharacterized protein n=1 Tax=Leersia perrieri TaxID=77586 RepID=A0A0D9WXI3_9ORYZ